ncbi:hypothetical protein AD006_30905 (plasmid) [Pseudonocardia sp. EC080610-09]|nr:hypothetical protein FRP1_29290 [Pseudonocardia sp. EC080625-04]ALL79863.1 hypothetical protein AD006_30905 [Pseudonocardia sp. EC080610-09]ALL85758.1 hypothetical protein AD017_30330 [Pseudonocardia sp. EC080619-01]ALL85940.1 hypothetical protein AD017_32345 [Pseudonocardia sp. EC080619-01]
MRVYGAVVDHEARCTHYRGPLDVVAMRFRCCDRYYPCLHCHAEHADHPARRWPAAERSEPAVLCGVCRTEMSVDTYVDTDGCPRCSAPFNPGCRLHHGYYFEPPPGHQVR